jgi:type IV pilus assembly protein PilY1
MRLAAAWLLACGHCIAQGAALADTVCAASSTVPALTGSLLRGGELKIVAGVGPIDGHGELAAYAFDETSGSFKTGAAWKAHEQMNNAASRAVITNNGPVGARLAARDAALGGILHSSPSVEGPPRGGYFGVPFAGYAEFAGAWAQRRTLVWVGAADGMLHAFDASSGKPVFSYLPEALFAGGPQLASAAKPKLPSTFDGTAVIGDVRTAAGWSSMLFAPLGRGAKAIVALDVTDPAALGDEKKADKVFRWQFTARDDGSDLGHIVAEPTTSPFTRQAGQIAAMNNGKFALLSGNGVQSSSGKAVLYVLFADGPADNGDWTGRFVKLVADTGAGNGLLQPVWVDENNDGVADSIYAGDLKGRLWKFDVRSSDPAAWKVAYGGRPLFIAKDANGRALPITGAPEFRFHPRGGVMLAIATGEVPGAPLAGAEARTHALFGIWDKPTFARAPLAELDELLPRDVSEQLEPRSFKERPDGNERSVAGAAIDWDRKLGWALPFAAPQEMSAANLLAASGQVLVATTSAGVTKPIGERDACASRIVARLTAVNALTGLAADGLLGSVPAKPAGGPSQSIASIRIAAPQLRVIRDLVGTSADKAAQTCSNGGHACSRIVGNEVDKVLRVPHTKARLFWREIPGLRTRQ